MTTLSPYITSPDLSNIKAKKHFNHQEKPTAKIEKKKLTYKGYSSVTLEEAMLLLGLENIEPLPLTEEFEGASAVPKDIQETLKANMRKTHTSLPSVNLQTKASREKYLDDILKSLLSLYKDHLKVQAERWLSNDKDKQHSGRRLWFLY
jgi:hypothetical protein